MLNLVRFKKVLVLCFIVSLIIIAMLIGIYLSIITTKLFPLTKYDDLLERLQNYGYTFILAKDYKCFLNSTNKIAIIVHDCDFKIDSIMKLREIEIKHKIKSTWFLRPEAQYFEQSINIFQQFQKEGWDIGLHYQALSRTHNLSMSFLIVKSQIEMMRLFFNITCIRHHGDYYDLSTNNHWIYGNYTKEFNEIGILEPCYDTLELKTWSYISDANGIWSEPKILGDKILVNIHSDWWK